MEDHVNHYMMREDKKEYLEASQNREQMVLNDDSRQVEGTEKNNIPHTHYVRCAGRFPNKAKMYIQESKHGESQFFCHF